MFDYDCQEIKLAEIMHVDMNKAAPQNAPNAGKHPHVFEIKTGTLTFFVGEDPMCGGPDSGAINSSESGVGLEIATHWENSIRQALMPVTPQPSSEPDKGEVIV